LLPELWLDILAAALKAVGVQSGCVDGSSMTFKLMLWSKDILEVMFFIGLTGCVGVVLISWISILKSAFSEKSED
jgi:hypothetical protein